MIFIVSNHNQLSNHYYFQAGHLLHGWNVWCRERCELTDIGHTRNMKDREHTVGRSTIWNPCAIRSVFWFEDAPGRSTVVGMDHKVLLKTTE